MIFNLAPQGSEVWLAARRGRITGSKFKDARDRSDGLDEKQRIYINAILSGKDLADARTEAGYKSAPTSALICEALAGTLQKKWGAKAISYAHDVARERMGGKPAAVYQNGAMRTGTEQEPFARQAYETVTGYLVQEVGFATTECGTFGLSLDGKIGDKGAVEIKTMVSSETLFSAVVDGDISEYEDQCYGAILFLDLDWIDLVLWTPDLEDQGLGLVIKRIERDDVKLAELEADLDAFAILVIEFEGQLRSKAAANIKALNQVSDQPTESPQMAPEEIMQEQAVTEAAKLVTHEAVVEIMMPASVAEAMKPVANNVPIPKWSDSVPGPIARYLATETPTLNTYRIDLNARLNKLDDEEIYRVLRFVQSRYPDAVAA